MIFRIDDVSVNTDLPKLYALMDIIAKRGGETMLAYSPLVHDVSEERVADRERAFPRILSAMSDHRMFFLVDKLGIPSVSLPHRAAAHGLVHVDHRLLGLEAQEMSIVMSCALVGCKTFVPPFNKWNADTNEVCAANGIELVKFEHGWKHVKFNDFNEISFHYYLHTHDTDVEWFEKWFSK